MFTLPEVGASAETSHLVTEDDLSHAYGNPFIMSLSSPRLQQWIEFTSSLLWEGKRDPRQEALLGIDFHFNHVAPSPPGANVTVKVTVSQVDRRRVRHTFEAWDEAGVICRGSSENVLLPMEKYLERVETRRRLVHERQGVAGNAG